MINQQGIRAIKRVSANALHLRAHPLTMVQIKNNYSAKHMNSLLSSLGITPSALSSKHGAAFGARWSMVGCAIGLLYIASCDLFIPPDRSVPRYNTVVGERRKPALNPGGALYRPLNQAPQSLAYEQAAPVAPVEQSYAAAEPTPASISAPRKLEARELETRKLEDIDPALARPQIADPRLNPQSQAQPKERSFWDRLAFWRSDEPVATANVNASYATASASLAVPAAPVAVIATAPVNSADLAPLPTTGNQQIAGNYPVLSQTPASPSAAVIDNAKARAAASQSELNAVSHDADAARNQLLKDATSEPSLLNNPPPPPPSSIPAPQTLGTVPYAGLQAKPTSAVESLTGNAISSRQRPIENPVSETPVKIVRGGVNSQTIARPPEALLSSNTLSGQNSSGIEPIRLTPPTDEAIAQGTASSQLASNNAASNAPITLVPPTSNYGNTRYLPPSRYAVRRSSGGFAN